jgi:hypothetical protein
MKAKLKTMLIILIVFVCELNAQVNAVNKPLINEKVKLNHFIQERLLKN